MKSTTLQAQIEQHRELLQSLQATVYNSANPTESELYPSLLEARSKLKELQDQLAASQHEDNPPQSQSKPQPKSIYHGRFLGPDTTGLKVEPTVRMNPVPIGIYHLLNPETDPLLTVNISAERSSERKRRVCVKCYIEGLSAQAVQTVEVERRQQVELKFLPTLFPERAREITEIQRATLHVLVEDLDNKPESHDTFSLVCLSRNSSFNAVHNPDTGEHVDLSHYYGAWVTPYVEPVQGLIWEAASRLQSNMVWGYLGNQKSVTEQVEALFHVLRDQNLRYINSVLDYGAMEGHLTQRTRLPRESLQRKSANCIDGTVLMASLLEGASLHPVLAIVPGHAFVGWKKSPEPNAEWDFLETMMIGSKDHDFQAACQSARRQYQDAKERYPDQMQCHLIRDLRRQGIWPME